MAGKDGFQLQASELSILIPAQNIEKEIPHILAYAAKQTKDLDAEFIIVDMGSSDKTVLAAVLQIKELGLHGFVIQNGVSNVPAALNTALQKAGGKYLTFLFARRLYSGFLPGYLDSAKRFGADLVFGCFTKEELRTAERRAISTAIRRPDGARFAKDLLRRKRKADLAAVLVRREFLMAKQISFDENCAFGYAEEFLLSCMLYAGTVIQAPVLLQRDEACELKRGKSGPVGFKVFRRVEAMLRVLETAQTVNGGDDELLRLLGKDIIPLAVMGCIDIVLREGVNHRTVRVFLNTSGYDKLLVVDRKSDPDLKRRILLWKVAPWLYRA
jgi:glycosyltransferase involved in cell wall biosynthesis